jgi:hypothetical protein
MEEGIMRTRMRTLRSSRKLVIAYTKNEIKTIFNRPPPSPIIFFFLRLAHRTKNP